MRKQRDASAPIPKHTGARCQRELLHVEDQIDNAKLRIASYSTRQPVNEFKAL
jgi:hypothetical protein